MHSSDIPPKSPYLTLSQPPRLPPKLYQFKLKTHTLTILISAPPTATVAFLKREALAALQSDVNEVEGVPQVSEEADFELCRLIKERGAGAAKYSVLSESQPVKQLTNWEIIYVQFKDGSGEYMRFTAIPIIRALCGGYRVYNECR